MTDDTERDPLARLRAADPAGDVEPRAGFADDVVARATGRAAEPAPVAALAAARARRRPRWVAIAAVAASIAIVGAAGYGIGATTGGQTNLADGSAPPISLPAEGNPADSRSGTTEGQEPAVGGPDQAASKDASYPSGYGRNQFSASGLGTSETTARAYAFDARAASSTDAVTRLAMAFGIASPVELKNGAWAAGPQDGSSPNLSVSLDGTLSFYFYDPRINPWQCEEGGECQPVGEAPTEEAAIGALRSLLVAAGRDPAAFVFTSQVWEGSPTRTAQARQVVNGHQIDQPWSVEVSQEGVFSAFGALAGVVELGEYAVVSEQEGFDRLSDPRFGASPTILPAAERATATSPEEWVPPTEPPATPSAGTTLAWPVNDVEIVSARLGLASQWQPNGSVLVVPAYEFTDSDGGVWSVIAVADSTLDFDVE